MTTIAKDSPLWLEMPAPGRQRQAHGGYEGHGYDPWISAHDGRCWVVDQAKDGQQRDISNRVQKWSVKDGQIEVTVSGGKTIKATETGESDAAHGRVTGTVAEDCIV